MCIRDSLCAIVVKWLVVCADLLVYLVHILDVYKRQFDVLTADVDDKFNIGHKVFCGGEMRNCFYYAAVSYTHLDVYKRQI